MSTITDAAGKFADRIAELLDVFDLSFFVSGAVAVGAIVWGARLDGLLEPKKGDEGEILSFLDGLSAESIFAAVIMAYALGLVCHAIGRFVRGRKPLCWLGRSPAACVEHAMRFHVLPERIKAIENTPLVGAEKASVRYDEIYTRLWVHIRTDAELKESFALTKRYWILGATFDGLIIAVVPWLWPLLHGADEARALIVVPAIVGAAIFCVWQAHQYRQYQAGELVASVAHWEATQRRAQEKTADNDNDNDN